MSEYDYIISKAIREIEAEFIDKGLRAGAAKKVAAAGLAGSMALGGGVGAAKAVPAVVHSGGHVVDTVRFAGSGSAQNWNNAVINAKARAAKTGKPQMVNTKNKEGWLREGRPGGVGWVKGSKTGTYTYNPNGTNSFSAGR